jgi:hypothetical protein
MSESAAGIRVRLLYSLLEGEETGEEGHHVRMLNNLSVSGLEGEFEGYVPRPIILLAVAPVVTDLPPNQSEGISSRSSTMSSAFCSRATAIVASCSHHIVNSAHFALHIRFLTGKLICKLSSSIRKHQHIYQYLH